jgi:CheY-like chemotaxis protein
MNNKIKILYVEDDKDDFYAISLLLGKSKSMDFEIDWARNPIEFYDKLKENQYDAFIVDYRLGTINGLDLIKKANIEIDKPIIMLTAYGSEDLDKEALEAGASFFVDKEKLSDDWQMLDKALRYCFMQSKRIYNSTKAGMRLQSAEDIKKAESIFSFDYLT